MEDGANWDLVTASIYQGDVERPAEIWSFLVAHGLVRDRPGDGERFTELAAQYGQVIRGSSPAFRVAERMREESMLLPRASIADPHGATAGPASRWFLAPGRSRTDVRLEPGEGERVVETEEGLHCERSSAPGIKHGRCVTFHRNGRLDAQGVFHEGQRRGVWLRYHDNGARASVANYDHGEMVGEATVFDRDGVWLTEAEGSR